MKFSLYGLTVVLTSALLVRVEAVTTHNVDVQEPFIIRSPGDPGDAFGWTAIFHQFEPADSSDTFAEALNKTRVLVGAPRGTFPSDIDPLLPRENRTGLVYSCPIVTDRNCEGVRGNIDLYIGPTLDNTTNGVGSVNFLRDFFPQPYSEGRLYDQAPNSRFSLLDSRNVFPQVESKTGQLMGASLFSSGDNVIACGALWDFVSLSATPASSPGGEYTTYRPYGVCFVGDRQLTGFVTAAPCVVESEGDRCLAGFSASIANGNVYVGSPAVRVAAVRYVGSIFQRSISAGTSDMFTQEGPSSIILYYGFDITTGYLTSRRSDGGAEDVVASAPRYRNGSDPSVGAVYQHGSSVPLAEGKQVAESFGYSVVLVDLDGDGYDEMVVGAPMYSTLKSSDFAVERGRIFIYRNDGAGSLNTTDPLVIMGKASRMRFGLKVANAGDLDSDGTFDLIVSAPYERSNSSNSTGAIYVYYGNRNMTEFMNQTPQRIHADDITSAVSNIDTIGTFGFTVSARVDVDNNKHADIVVGGYEDQIVTVLRTRPFANVQVEFGNVPDVNLTREISFNVTITANYSSNDPQLMGVRQFDYQLHEVTTAGIPNRLRFGPTSAQTVFTGMLSFNAQQIATETVVVYVDHEGESTVPYQLRLSLMDTDKLSTQLDKSGRTVDSLTSLPRFRIFGNPLITVNISDLCNGDDCQSDVIVTSGKDNIAIVAGRDLSVPVLINYVNIGLEEARNLQLVITDIPSSILGAPQVFSATEGFDCQRADFGGFRNATCDLAGRLNSGDSRNLTITMQVVSNIGNEPRFSISVLLLVDMTGNNTDTNPSNNAIKINFNVDSISDSSVVTSFPQAKLQYSAVLPRTPSSTIDLGVSERLTVRVANSGPTTIQAARVTIYFPSRSQTTGTNYFLYPIALNPAIGMSSVNSGTKVVCGAQNIDPDCLDNSPSNTNCPTTRKKRSEPLPIEGMRVRRADMAASDTRLPRQEPTLSGLNCNTSPMDCLMFVCNVTRLTTANVDLLLDYAIDERFFSSQVTNLEYNLTALATVEVLDEFQKVGDKSENDRSVATVLLIPPTSEDAQGPLFYVAIILPIVFGLIILVIIAVLLYFFGFFRRKRKPGEEDEELEPVPAPVKAAVASEESKEEEITKV